jgi:hypothetical protein
MTRKQPVTTPSRYDQQLPQPLHAQHALQFARAVQVQNDLPSTLDRRADPNRASSRPIHTSSLRNR